MLFYLILFLFLLNFVLEMYVHRLAKLIVFLLSKGSPATLSLISLDHETGEIVVADRVDREVSSWLNFSVEATDSGVPPRSSFVDVLVQVS